MQVLFAEFENLSSDENNLLPEKQRSTLEKIVQTIGQYVDKDGIIQENEIDPNDMQNVVIPNICKITVFYNIPSKICSYTEESELAPIPETITEDVSEKKLISTTIKVLIIIVASIV
ncbi:MAG: hypothetical protein NZM44_01595 [Candidatus Calescibacterium sp.]|nr:hypothetical protein [Candidatus Calescibacterium sp.]